MVKKLKQDEKGRGTSKTGRNDPKKKRVPLIKFRWAGKHIGQKPFKDTPMW